MTSILLCALVGFAAVGCEQDSDIGDPIDSGGTMADGGGQADGVGMDASLPDGGESDSGGVDAGPSGDTGSPDDAGGDVGDVGVDGQGDGGLGTYPSSTPEETYESYFDLSVKADCRELTTPSCRTEREPPTPGFPPASICERRKQRHGDVTLNSGRYALKKAVESGRQSFDQQAAEACIEMMEEEVTDATPCEQFYDTGETQMYSFNSRYDDSPCERVLRPEVGEDGKCLMRSDCKPGLHCDEEALADQCGGRCVPLGGEGDACDLSALECEPGLDCIDGQCQSDESSDDSKSVGETCESTSECQGDLNCKEETGDGMRCREPVGPGQTCEFGDCESGYACVRDPSNPEGDTRICLERGSRSAGESCTEPGVCESGLVCHENTCREVERPGEGESCEGGLEYCQLGLVCRPTAGGSGRTCEPYADVDEPCVDGACKPELYCRNDDEGEGVCKPTKGEGASCEPGACQDDFYCVAEVCTERSAPGARCDQKVCEQGVRCTYYDNNNVCGGITSRCTLE